MIEKSISNKPKRRWLLYFFLASVCFFLITCISGVFFYWTLSRDLPKITSITDYQPALVSQVIAIEDGKEVVLGEFFKERRYIVPVEHIPEILINAFIATEDQTFFEHEGVSLPAIIRAGIANFKAGHVVQGGSTITMQLSRSMFLTPERSIIRKIKEAILAGRAERNLSKEQILYLYLNQIYLGHGAYGVQAASRAYFNKDISQITLSEAALIASMPKAPSKFDPFVASKRVKERQLYVLKRMKENGYIANQELEAASAEPIRVYRISSATPEYASYYIEHIRRHLVQTFGNEKVYEKGLKVVIPAKPSAMKGAQSSVQEGLRALDKRRGYRGPVGHLNSEQEVEEKLAEIQKSIITELVPYEMLMPDGELTAVEGLKERGILQNGLMIQVEKIYKAIVMSVDDPKGVAIVGIGSARAKLPIAHLAWASPYTEVKVANKPPTLVSKVLNTRDIIWVKVIENKFNGITVALEQEPQVEGALLSIEVQSGHVLAMVGGFNFERSEFNRAIQAQRQPGSAFKALIFSAALESGYAPNSVIMDSPIVYDDEESGKWKPENYEEKFYGDTTFRLAFIKSRNVPTIKLVEALGVQQVIDYTARLGLTAAINNDLSLSLGSGAASLLELTKVYGLFARYGTKLSPIFLKYVLDASGKVLEEHLPHAMNEFEALLAVTEKLEPPIDPNAESSTHEEPHVALNLFPNSDFTDQAIDPRVAFQMIHLLKDVINHGTGHDAHTLGRPAAGKTGTTNDYNDAWFIGFTPQIVTGVWVGYDDHRPLGPGETGAKAALPIWLNYMKEAVKSYPEVDFPIPPGVFFATIDSQTGKPAAKNSPNGVEMAFIEQPQGIENNDKNTGSDIQSESEFLKEDLQ